MINLSERPNSRDLLTLNKKVARSLRPCTLRRPMSATPSFGYRDHHVSQGRKLPPWSRPQSAGGSSSLRRNKLAAKFFDPSLNDPDYCPQFGATYTLSSSQLLQSLMGSCSINEGLNSDTTITPTPSPQPSLGDTIRAAAQLEPGLTGKPPLPPTPTPTHTPHSSQTDDIISLKFQRWFPDAILESEIIKQTTLNIKPFEKPKDETDLSDAGTSELSDKDSVEKQPSTSNMSSFVKKSRSPKTVDEDPKKLTVTFDDNQIAEHEQILHNNISPTNFIHEPDPYGCDVVTEEFASESNFCCLTPDNGASLKKSNHFAIEKNAKGLSLSDLNDSTVMNPEVRAHSLKVFSDSKICKDGEYNAHSNQTDITHKGFSDVELKNDDEKERHINSSFTQAGVSRNEILSPSNFESSASNFRSTPVGIETANYQQSDGLPEKEGSFTTNSENTTNKDTFKSKYKSYDTYNSTVYDSSYNHKRHHNDISNYSPPIILISEGEEVYHDHLIPQKPAKNDAETVDFNTHGNTQSILTDNENDNTTFKLEIHTNLKNDATPLDRSFETDTVHKKIGKRHPSVVSERRNNECKSVDKYGSLDSTNKTVGQKNKNHFKEINRAASVPPFPPSKSLQSISKPCSNKDEASQSQKTKHKVKRSMSYDANSIADISEKDSGVSSYEDIVTMIKVLEKEDLESPIIQFKTSSPVALLPEQSSSAKAILNFLDEVERGSMAVVETDRSIALCTDDTPRSGKEASAAPVSSRLGTLLNTDSAELAKQVMTLTLQLEEAVARNQALEERQRQSVQLLKQQQAESNDTNKRHQSFIDQLLKEKRQLAVQYETAIKEMEAKQESAIKVIEERHKVEMKKAQDKFNAAEKIRRDKWIDTKTKKIKELTVRGLEPELERMAVAHQSELAELRRVHQRQLTEAEAAWARRSAALREQEAAERQTAVQLEREAARHRLEQEMSEVEKSYQEQRRRLLEEVRQEKELLQRQSERLIAEKHTELARQVDEAKCKVQNKLVEYEKKHQEEIAKLRESIEAEKQAWITRHKGGLEEKEAMMREELKRERDRHIELVIRRLESESAAKEQAIENKIKRLKESYDGEVSDLDLTLRELRARLKDARADLQRSEDHNATLTSQLSHAHSELQPLKQAIEKLRKEYDEAMQQSGIRVADMQKELNEAKRSFQDQVNKIHNDKENQLQQVYTRVKDAISKKEEALQLVSRQRDAALEQCSRLEKLLETQRSHSLQL